MTNNWIDCDSAVPAVVEECSSPHLLNIKKKEHGLPNDGSSDSCVHDDHMVPAVPVTPTPQLPPPPPPADDLSSEEEEEDDDDDEEFSSSIRCWWDAQQKQQTRKNDVLEDSSSSSDEDDDGEVIMVDASSDEESDFDDKEAEEEDQEPGILASGGRNHQHSTLEEQHRSTMSGRRGGEADIASTATPLPFFPIESSSSDLSLPQHQQHCTTAHHQSTTSTSSSCDDLDGDDPMRKLAECMERSALSRSLVEAYCHRSFEQLMTATTTSNKMIPVVSPSMHSVRKTLNNNHNNNNKGGGGGGRESPAVARRNESTRARTKHVMASSKPGGIKKSSSAESLLLRTNPVGGGSSGSNHSSRSTKTKQDKKVESFRLSGLKCSSSEKLRRLDAKLQMLKQTPQVRATDSKKMNSAFLRPMLVRHHSTSSSKSSGSTMVATTRTLVINKNDGTPKNSFHHQHRDANFITMPTATDKKPPSFTTATASPLSL